MYLTFAFCLTFFLTLNVSSAHAEALADTDGDGLPDRWESEVYKTDPTLEDTDHDGFSDRQEIVQGFNPLGEGVMSVPWGDADHDGLDDRGELLFGTDPLNPDTDGDGRLDGAEVAAAFSPTSTLPIALAKTIVIDVGRQNLERRVMGITISSTPISSGKSATPTPLGDYKVLNKNLRAWSSLAKLWMPYWMHFSGRGHGIHELPEWPGGKKEGANHLGHPVSHGCVRLGIGPAKELFEWAPLGTPVQVLNSLKPTKLNVKRAAKLQSAL